MPADLELALRVRADMREALQGLGTLNRSLGDTARRGGEAGASLTGATGAARAFTTALGAIGRESGSTLDQAREAAETVFGAMESALTGFVTTGSVSFASFADSVIADLARIATRRYVTGPLANLLFGGFAGSAATGSAHLFHAGGTVGALGGVTRSAGLRADEVPVIAQRGEIILPRGAHVAAPSITVNFENRGTPQREVSREVRFDPRGIVVSIVTDDIRRGGPIRQTMQRELGGVS